MGEMPGGVPVRMTSPGISVMTRERKQSKSRGRKINVPGIRGLTDFAVYKATDGKIVDILKLGLNPRPMGQNVS